MKGLSRTTAVGCAGKGLGKGPQQSVLVGWVSPFLISPAPKENGGWGGESSKQNRSGGCPSLASPPIPQPYTETDSRVCPQTSLGCQALRGGLPWPICKTSSLPQAEQKGGKVDSQNPGSNLHLAAPGETPTRPRLNRDQAQPFECQVGN